MSIKRGLAVAAPVALAVSLAGFALSAHALYQTQALNARIMQGKMGKLEDDAPPEALFAKAYELRNDWKLDAALQLYHRLEQVGDPELQVKVNYNIGNIHVTRAQIEARFHRLKNIGTLVGIARTQYQRALRIDSDFFDAKYNLEYTRFLVTERDSDEQKYEGGLGHQEEERKMNWAEFQELPKGLP